METLHFDVVTIGGGPGATPGAQYLAKYGKHVAIIEQGEGLGGTCLFEGCIPSKIFLETADRLTEMGGMDKFGILGAVPGRVDLPLLRQRKRDILTARIQGANRSCEKLGITIIQGTADFINQHQLLIHKVNQPDVIIEAAGFFVAPGSTTARVPIPGAENPEIWTSAQALEMNELPESLTIIGGGYIGCELATLYRHLQCKVHILEIAPRLLLTEDPTVSAALLQSWQTSQPEITVTTGITIENIEHVATDSWNVNYKDAEGKGYKLPSSQVLIAVGRRPNTKGLAWDKAGITLGQRGEVPVNEYYQTVVPHIYAPGDVNGKMMLAHAATRQSLLAARHWVGQLQTPVSLVVPHVIFTSPEIGAVGADSRDLKDHPTWKSARWSYAQDARARIVGDVTGFAQIIWDGESHQIKGLQVVGSKAGELIEEVTNVITHNGTLESIEETIHPHPTLNEIISELVAYALTIA